MISNDDSSTIIESVPLAEAESTDNQTTEANVLFRGDTGSLPLDTRRAMVHLLAGPFISGQKHSKLWSALLRDESVIREHLSELFLDVVIDRDQQIAFIKQAESDGIEIPILLRRSQLTFIDSALILHLRRCLGSADAQGERCVISSSEILEHLSVFERASSTDRAGFTKRVSASIEKLKKNNILHPIRSAKDRFEISPTLKLLFSPEEIIALTRLYEELAKIEGSQVKLRKKKLPESAEEQDDNDE